jgi:nucleoside 2-deoxyribosyltransferase
MSKKKLLFDLYLSLGMHGRLGRDVIEQMEEAKKFCKMYNVSYYSPCDDELIDPDKIIDAKPNRRRMRHFVRKDDANIDLSGSLLLLTGDKSSSGTLWESGRMRYLNRRHVLLVAPKMYRSQLANFSTIKAIKIFGDVESAVKWVARNKTKLRKKIPIGEL